jgi:hypothetical protein
VQDLPYFVLAHAESFEASQDVTDPANAPVLVLTLERHDLFLLHDVRCLRRGAVSTAP